MTNDTDDSDIQITIGLQDPELDAEELDYRTQNIYAQMRDLDEVEQIKRVADPNPPQGNKALVGFLSGILKAEVKALNFKKLMSFLAERIGSKPIELEIEANGKKLKIQANSHEELQMAIQAAQKFIEEDQ